MKRFINTKTPFLRLFHYAHDKPLLIVSAIISSLLNRIMQSVSPIFIGLIINGITNGPTRFLSYVGIASLIPQLIFLSILFCAAQLVQVILQYNASLYWRRLGQYIQHNVRISAHRHLQLLHMDYHENTHAGSLATLINEDVNIVEDFIDVGFDNTSSVIINMINVIVIFSVTQTHLMIFALIPLPIIVLATYYMFVQCSHIQKNLREYADRISNLVTHSVEGITLIKTYNTYAQEENLLKQESATYQHLKNNFDRLRLRLNSLMKASIIISTTLVIIFGGLNVIKGTLLIGTYTMLINSLKQLLTPVHTISTIVHLANRTLESAKRLFALLDTPIIHEQGELLLSQETPSITIESVSFRYPNNTLVFNNISCEIPAGTTVALKGKSGSGKSTFGKMLVRLYEPSSGHIKINHLNLKDIHLESIRKTITIVSQEAFLFPGTIYDNITYGLPPEHHVQESIIHAAHLAHAHDFIINLPEGYHTRTGEHGKRISGGQRQRIALARALLRNTPILILDEALSANEEETEYSVYQHLIAHLKEKTIIFISHRSIAQECADITLDLNDGMLYSR